MLCQRQSLITGRLADRQKVAGEIGIRYIALPLASERANDDLDLGWIGRTGEAFSKRPFQASLIVVRST